MPQRSSSVGRDRLDLRGSLTSSSSTSGALGQPLGHALGDAQAAAEAGEHDLGALLLGARGDRVGDRALGQHAGDQELASIEQHLPATTAEQRDGIAGSTLGGRVSSAAHASVLPRGHQRPGMSRLVRIW